MTDTAPETSSPAPTPAAAASTSTTPKTTAPKRKSKPRRKTRRRDGSDSDASSDGSVSDSANAAPKSAKGKGKAKQKPLFPESSHTTPLVWADADVSQNEIVSFDFGDSSSKSTKPTPAPGKPQREFTEEQRKRHEEKLRIKKEKQKAKRRAAKEAKAKEKEASATKDSKPKDGAEKTDAAPKAPQPSKDDASLAASTSALKLDDPAPAPTTLPTSTPASGPSTSPPTAAATAATTTTPAVRLNQPFAPHRPLRERLSNPPEGRFAPRPPHWANDQRQPVRPMPNFWRGRGGPRGIPRGAFRGFPRGRGRGGFGPFGPGGPHFRPPFRPPGPPHGPPNAVNAAVANNAAPTNAPSAPRAMLEAPAASGSGTTPASEQPETTETAKTTELTESNDKPQPTPAQTQPAQAQQPVVPPHQRLRPNMPRPEGRWGHDGFHQHMREDAFRANRGMRARGRGRGFAPRGGFRPFFNHPGQLPTPEVSPDRAEKPAAPAAPAAKPAESASIEALLDDSGAVTVRLPGETETVSVDPVPADSQIDTRPPSQPTDLVSQSPLPPAFTPSNPSPGPYSDAGSMSSSGYVGPIPAEYYGGVAFRPPPYRGFQSFTPEPFQPGHASHTSHASRGSFSGFFSGSPMDPRAGSPFNPYAPGFVMPAVGKDMTGEPKSPHSEGTDSMPGAIQTPEFAMAPYYYNPYAEQPMGQMSQMGGMGGVFYPPQGYWPQQYEGGMYYEGGEFQQQGHQHQF